MLAGVHEYGPTERSFARGRQLGVIVDVDPGVVANAIVGAVRRDRRHVRLPRRSSLLMMLGEAPRRLTEIILTGVDHHRHP
jgi:hypothetical protein